MGKNGWRNRCINSMAGVSLLLGLAIAALPTSARAGTCRLSTPAPASAKLAPFTVNPFGITVNIPDNYRSMLRSSGHITFHDPHSFAFIQCLVRTGESGEVPPYVAIEVHKGINRTSEMIDLIRTRRPWLDYYNPEYEPVEFAGQLGVRYDYTHEIYQLAIANISFLSPDGHTLLTLTGPVNHPIMVNALATIEAGILETSD